MADTYVYDSSTPRQIQALYVNDAGTWRTIQQTYVNDSGTWRTVQTFDIILQLTVGYDNVVGPNENRGYSGSVPFGSLSSTSIGAYTINSIIENRLDGGGTFNSFNFSLSGSPALTKGAFSTLNVNGRTYTFATSTTFNSVGGGNWGWTSPDSALTTSSTYTVTIVR